MVWTLGWAAALILCIAAFLFIEDSTVAWVSMWLAAGALAALVLSLISIPFILQLLIFILIVGIFLFLLKPSIRKRFPIQVQPTNANMILGKYAPVTVSIDNITGCGQIKIEGMEWSARSTDGQPIKEGTVVCIHHIEGVKAFVFPISEDFILD